MAPPAVLSPLAGSPDDQVAAAKDRGTKAFRTKDFPAAVKAYSEALAITPDDHTLLSNRSAAYGAMEQYKEAHIDAKQCVRLRPNWAKGYARLGFALVHLFRLEEAQQAYQNGLKQEPDAAVEKTLNSGLEDVSVRLQKEADAEEDDLSKMLAEKKGKDPSNRRRGLNHKPAWQSQGIGINEKMFGETKGDLMKPGLTKADLERIEKQISTGPDPFGDVFREGTGKANPKVKAPPTEPVVPPTSKAIAVRTKKALASAPWRLSSLCLGAVSKAKAAAPPGAAAKALPPWRASRKSRRERAEEEEKEAEYDPFSTEPVNEDVKAAPPKKAPGPLMTANLPVKAPPRVKGAPIKMKAPPTAGMSKASIKATSKSAIRQARQAASAAAGATQKAFAKRRPTGMQVFAKGGAHTPPPPPLGAKAPPPPPLRGPPPKRKGAGKGKGKVVPPPPGQPLPPPMTTQQTEDLRALMKEKMMRLTAQEGEGRKQADAPAKRRRSSADQMAENFLKRGGMSRRAQMEKSAVLAEEYFNRAGFADIDEEPVAKKQKRQKELVAESFAFAPEILEKAPDNVQTLRSLLQFLEKKLQAELPAAPVASGPEDLHSRLEAHADSVGRLSALRATSGWDARAKRVLDIAGTVKTPEGGKALEAAEKRVEQEKLELEKQLKEKKSESELDACIEKRTAWAKDSLKRDWLTWCSRLCQAREVLLMEKAEKGNDAKAAPAAPAKPLALSSMAILERLFSSEKEAAG